MDIAASYVVPADLYASILTADRQASDDTVQQVQKPSSVITAEDVAAEAYRRGVLAGLSLYKDVVKMCVSEAEMRLRAYDTRQRKRGDKA